MRKAVPDLRDCRVLVTPTTFGGNDPSLKKDLETVVGEVVYNPLDRPLRAQELCLLVEDADGYIAGLDQIDASVINAARRLKVIARYGVGIDTVDVRAATSRGIVVTNTPGANAGAVAELTVALILALARNLHAACNETRAGRWPRATGLAMRGRTVGLVGFGAVGRAVAARLAAFGCPVIASDPFADKSAAQGAGVGLVPLPKLLRAADFVSLHASLTPSTRAMVNENFLSRMKPASFLVNTARGELIDEDALVASLRAGKLAGAALDCFGVEPPRPDNPLLGLPQVIVTPHMAAHTDEATNLMGRMALEDCLAVLRGLTPQHPVNEDVVKAQVKHGREKV
jgi:D-3-phosphoglycerate dehydrogenase